MNGYDLSRYWFNWCFENTGKYTPAHTALYMWICERWNRLGKKEKFGLPAMEAMEIIGISKNTYYKVFNDLVSWEFIFIESESKNQHSATVISLNQNLGKQREGKKTALDQALIQQMGNQLGEQGDSRGNIDKPINQEPITINQEEARVGFSDEVKKLANEMCQLFSISEMKNNDSFRKIFKFLTEIEKTGQLQYFSTQFNSYQIFKSESKTQLHGLFNFIGYDKFNSVFDVMKGSWNECNWSEKLAKTQGAQTVSKSTTTRPLTDEDYK